MVFKNKYISIYSSHQSDTEADGRRAEEESSLGQRGGEQGWEIIFFISSWNNSKNMVLGEETLKYKKVN